MKLILPPVFNDLVRGPFLTLFNLSIANDNQKMERFIRDKYERKKYCASQPPALRDASILGLGGAAPQQVLPIDYSFDLSKDFAIHVLKVLLV